VRAVVQRVHAAHVEVNGEVTGRIGRGLVAFVGAAQGDTDADMTYTASKVVGLRVFPDESGRMARSVSDVGGGLLVISQFTVLGDVRRGLRPSFDAAMEPGLAEELYNRFVDQVRKAGVDVATGRFRAEMRVSVQNDGPVTILIDSRKTF
jgi:D-tyrosyl-tRNA(Tyr) deacylase